MRGYDTPQTDDEMRADVGRGGRKQSGARCFGGPAERRVRSVAPPAKKGKRSRA